MKVVKYIGSTEAVEPLIKMLEKLNNGRDKYFPAGDWHDDYPFVIRSICSALNDITNKNFGDDIEKWRSWWEEIPIDSQ